MTDTPDGNDGRHPAPDAFSAADSLRILREQQDRARSALVPDGRLLCLLWGVAWLAGYLVLWTSARGTEGIPSGPAFVIFGGLLAAAIVITIVHSARRTGGTRGAGQRAGVLWGFTWCLAFLAYPFIIGGIARAGASDDVIGLVANGLACMIVGIMYLTGSACFADDGLYVLGAWIVLTGGVATSVGMPGTYLVMALLGGGGFLVITLVLQVIHLRRRRRADTGLEAAAVRQGPGDD
ncbi:hypothetical protein LEP48_14230 [Isoptericola sp. NEAU-Y5]|uniref:Uncharacterized protein n=1 Tax=Isoptericola luteus TaxID=2879484 RepID=A0ABS7ZHI4_9MICO|nr:hypothetical protein [Isoptericola sp. NEAU-Y5]MCA5894495.1 hypothetical protein [Isoptericola sp. NEAU-Y5]